MNKVLNIEETDTRLVDQQIYVGSSFYSKAETLRNEFDQAVLGQNGQHGGMTPLAYAYCENIYQFLTAGAERCFSEDVLAELIEALNRWGNNVLGTSHVSTPQVRVYVSGCLRKRFRDDVSAPWHFIFSLTGNHKRQKHCRIWILEEAVPQQGKFTMERIVSSVPVFNQLLVHSTRSPYSVEEARTSMNPLEGTVLVDGYMW